MRLRRLVGSMTALALVSLALVSTGCDSKTQTSPIPRTGTIAGTITVDGKAVGSGRVWLTAQDGSSHSCTIGPSGTYQVEGVPVGRCRIGVDLTSGVPKGLDIPVKDVPATPGATPPGLPALPPKLAEKYRDPNTSQLTHEIGEGTQEKNIDIPTRQ